MRQLCLAERNNISENHYLIYIQKRLVSKANNSGCMKGMVKRTEKDKIIDRFITLYVLTNAPKHTKLGRVQLQKILFLSEWKMISQKMKGLNYNYIKFEHGPYSPELQADMDRFAKLGETQSSTLRPTEKGFHVVDDFANVISDNKPFFDIVDKYTHTCTSVELQTLLDKVYSLRHPMRPNMTIAQTPLRTPLLYPIDESNTEVAFAIRKSDLEDLAMSLDQKIVKKLEDGLNDLKNGRLVSHRELFGSV